MRISDWSSDVCSSDLQPVKPPPTIATSATTSPASGGAAGPGGDEAAHSPWVRGTSFIRRPCQSCAIPSGHGHHGPTSFVLGIIAVETCQSNEYSRSEEHTSELQSLMRISYAVFCLKKKKKHKHQPK